MALGLLQVHRQPHGGREVVQVAAEGLIQPVHSVGAEQQPAAPVEPIDRAVQRRRAFLHQVKATTAGVGVALDIDRDQVQVALDQFCAQRMQLGPTPADLGVQGAVEALTHKGTRRRRAPALDLAGRQPRRLDRRLQAQARELDPARQPELILALHDQNAVHLVTELRLDAGQLATGCFGALACARPAP